ncbi:MAG: DNA-directed DNA polymerase II small subunit [Haloferacaceae archaeon]
MPLETPVRLVRELASHGYNAEREAVTLLAGADDPDRALAAAIERAPDDALVVTPDLVRDALADGGSAAASSAPRSDPTDDGTSPPTTSATAAGSQPDSRDSPAPPDSSDSADSPDSRDSPAPPDSSDSADATDGSASSPAGMAPDASSSSTADSPGETEGSGGPAAPIQVAGDVTGRSTGTGAYDEFVDTFRDRYERLSAKLSGRVNRRPAAAIAEMSGGSEAALVGLVNDVRSTTNGHWLIELEDTTGTFPCLVTKNRELADLVDLLLLDECVAVEGRLSDDGGLLFADALHFPDVPRTHRPSTADREVAAALVSDLHVGSQEFAADAWAQFADWLHSPEADHVEYLLIAGDMVEGVGVYPGQDEELDIVDIYEQYETFSERLKEVPGEMEVVMIPGNHDAVRLAEPQPGFDEELRDVMSAHDARIVGNPATVTVEGVSVLMYHGVSLDEVIAELPAEEASYDDPHRAMHQLLRKRHLAPQYGGRMQLAPEERDYLVVDEVPDVFHAGHVHKLGYGTYHGVLAINSACWQEQTSFQRKVDIDPDVGYAPIVRLDTLDLTVRDFAP